MGKAPSAPSAASTANAQQAANLISQNNPFGSLTYTQTGSNNGVDTYTANTTLSPQVQAAIDASLGAQTNLSKAAQSMSANIGSQLGQPLDWSAQQGYLNDITAQNLDRSWDRQAQQFETDLVNRGIRPGSTAYQQQIGDFRADRSNAYNTANLANMNTALQNQLTLRQLPLNELNALMSGGQVQLPQFGSTPQTDVAGITNSAYANQMANYNANQGLMGGLFSAGASLLPLLSDLRAKTNIRRIGTADNGLGIYVYQYLTGGPFTIGVLAQEVEKVNPEAVVEGPDGLKRVFYDKAFS